MVIQLNGQDVEFPNSFGELRARTFQNLYQPDNDWGLEKEVQDRDYFKLFNILLGNSGKQFSSMEDRPENQEAVYQLTRWVNETAVPYTREVPKSLTISHRTLTIPENIGALSVGQNILLKQRLDKYKFLEGALTYATAVYLQPQFDSVDKVIKARVNELDLLLQELPASLIYPIGFFLLNRAIKNGMTYGSDWHRALVNRRLALVTWLRDWLALPGLRGFATLVYQ